MSPKSIDEFSILMPLDRHTQKWREDYRTRWIDQIRKDKEMRGGKWEEIQENRKWEFPL